MQRGRVETEIECFDVFRDCGFTNAKLLSNEKNVNPFSDFYDELDYFIRSI